MLHVNFPKLWEKNLFQKISIWWAEKPNGILWKWMWNLVKRGIGLTAIFGLIQYFAGISKQERQNYFQAWQLINTSNGQTGIGGRIEALEYLNLINCS